MIDKNKYKPLLDKYHTSPKGWLRWVSSKENKYFIEQLREDFPNLSDIKEILYWLDNDLQDYPKCPICGKSITKFKGRIYGYFSHCSCRCTQLDNNVRAKYKATNIQRHGNPTYNNSEKNKQTCLIRYGVGNVFQSEIIKSKIKATNLIKYGVENAQQNNNISARTKQTLIERYGVNCGFKCSKKVNKSIGELELFNEIHAIYDDAISGDRDTISPLELDIYIPSLNIAIEYDGEYWHSLPNMKRRDNLKNKICLDKGIKLFRIAESCWLEDRDLTLSNLLKEISKYE